MSWDRLTLVTGPTQRAILLEEAKAHLRVEAPDEDALIMGYVAAAEARIDGPDGIGWALMSQTWKLTLDAFPTTETKLALAPVTAVDSITYVDTAGDTQTWAVANYRVDLGGEPARVTKAFGVAWPITRLVTGAVVITFITGATNPGDVPETLRHAMLLMIGDAYRSRENIVIGTIAVKLPVSMATEELLANYRRPAF